MVQLELSESFHIAVITTTKIPGHKLKAVFTRPLAVIPIIKVKIKKKN